VSPSGSTVRNITVGQVDLGCVPATASQMFDQHFTISKAGVRRNGTFTARFKVSAAGTRYGYFIAGRFKPAGSSGAASVAGTLREDMTYTDTTKHRCTSNVQPWSATKSGPAPRKTALRAQGHYAGQGHYGIDSVSFDVTGTSLVNAVVNQVDLDCVPRAASQVFDQAFAVPKAAIKPDGSFRATVSQHGAFGNAPATITYTLAGNLQGAGADGVMTAAESLREDVVFTGAPAHGTCSSGVVPWTASRAG
jgi:hypothetical protein